jgi:amidase
MGEGPLWQWSASEIVAATTAKEIRCREVVESVVARIHAVNPELNAITLDLGDDALAAADQLDESLARGDEPGPLHGVPVTIKDNIDVKGQRTPNGLPGLAGLIAPDDSPVTRNLLGAGGILVGRTNTPEVSMRPTTDNPLYGLTLNPWDHALSCGGSSGGAGVAVLSGMCAIGHGNDIGGSVRIPALHCGVPGLKPTMGRIPAHLPSAAVERATVPVMMSVQGPLARSVADVRLGLAVMARRDHRDPWWVPAPLDGPPVPARAGVLRRIPGVALDPSVERALDDAAAALARAGYEVSDVEAPRLDELAGLAFRLLMNDLDLQLGPVLDRLGSDTMRAYWAALRDMGDPYPSVGAYVDDLAARTTILREWLDLLETCPVLVSPLLAGGVLEVGEDARSPEDVRRTWRSLVPSIAVNLLGLPAALAPTGLVEGRPTGVQLVGSRYREDVCLAAAEAVEASCGSLAQVLWARDGAIGARDGAR